MRSWLASEDWFAVWLGVIVVGLALPAAAGCDLLGWIFAPQVWLNATSAVRPVSKAYAGLPGAASLLSTYLFLLALVGLGAAAQRYDMRAFLPGFTVIFWISVACWLLGHYAYLAQTPDKRGSAGMTWSLGLTGEAGYLVALLAGLFVGNLLPGLVIRLKTAARPEWYIKTAIVILGAGLGVKAAGASSLVTAILFRGLAAIIEAYLLSVAQPTKVFRFQPGPNKERSN